MLCRDVFHCLPDELDRQDAARIEGILVAMGAEGRVRDARSRPKASSPRSKPARRAPRKR